EGNLPQIRDQHDEAARTEGLFHRRRLKLLSWRACPGHPRLHKTAERRTWMPGTRPGMTVDVPASSSPQHHAGVGRPRQPDELPGREAALALPRIRDGNLHQRAVGEPDLVERHVAAIAGLVQ